MCYMALETFITVNVSNKKGAGLNNQLYVIRCGMIYMEPNQLGLNPPILSWLQKELPKNLTLEQRQLIEVG